MQTHSQPISAAETIAQVWNFVRKELAGMDGSHDIHHIIRVHKLALRLGREEGLTAEGKQFPSRIFVHLICYKCNNNKTSLSLKLVSSFFFCLNNIALELVEISAILHDIADWKYSGDDNAGPSKAAEFLTSLSYPEQKILNVVAIIKGVSYHTELMGTTQAK